MSASRPHLICKNERTNHKNTADQQRPKRPGGERRSIFCEVFVNNLWSWGRVVWLFARLYTILMFEPRIDFAALMLDNIRYKPKALLRDRLNVVLPIHSPSENLPQAGYLE